MIDFDTVVATGIGSWPGESMAETVRIVFAESPELPYLPELPDRGAPAGLIGRTTAILSGLTVDLQPAGWRLTDGVGADQRRARSLLRADLDQLDEAADGYSGPLKLAFAGPWTLAAGIERPRGDRALADHGARRELVQSLTEGLIVQLAELRRRLPDVRLMLQLDEPMLPAVLAGALPTASGFSRHRAVEQNEVIESYRALFAAVGNEFGDGSDAREQSGVPEVIVHCCARRPPFELLRTAGFETVAVDLGLLDGADWDQIVGWFEGGGRLAAGVLPADRAATATPDQVASRVLTPFRRIGVDPALTRRLLLTPACGWAGASQADAIRGMRVLRRAASLVEEQLED